MKRASGPKAISLNSRLFAIFTATFLLALIIQVVFLRLGARAIELNATADAEHRAAQEIFAIKQALSRMEIAHNHFEITEQDADLVAFRSLSSRLYALLLQSLSIDLEEAEAQALDAFSDDLDRYTEIFDQIELALLEEDYEQVMALDEEAYTILPGLYERLDALIAISSERVDAIDDESRTFQAVVLNGAILGLLLFILLASAALLLIHRQINSPLGQLSKAIAAIESGHFDPASIQRLAARSDEIGAIASELIKAAQSLSVRQETLEQQAAEIRRKIR